MSPDTLVIDVAMPTYQSGSALAETLQHLAESERAGPVSVGTFHVIDNESDDDTVAVAEECADRYGWRTDIVSQSCSLPAARRIAIDRIETEWFLFLDDDVHVSPSYLETLATAIAPSIGGIQGRKSSEAIIDPSNKGRPVGENEGHPSSWVRRRAFRGGTHATLIRREAVADVRFPEDLLVWEDEYLRREVESNGYLWVFNHQARFDHLIHNPREQGWSEGYVQGKYGLRPTWHVCMGVPYAMVSSGSSPVAATKQVAGYAAGRLVSRVRST